MRTLSPTRTSTISSWQGPLLIAGLVVSGALAFGMLVNAPPLLIVAGGVGLLFATIFLNRPDLGLLIVLFVRAFTDLSQTALGAYQGIGKVVTSPNTGLVLILFFAGGLFVLSRRVNFLSLPGGTPLVVLLLTGLIGMLRTENLLFSVDQWLRATSAIVVYALAAYLFQTRARIQMVIDVLAISFVIPAVIGFDQLITRKAYHVADLDITRVYGTFVHPNAFGFFLVIFFSIFLCQSVVQSGKRRFVAMSIVAASAILLLATYARASWAGAFVVLVLVGILSKRGALVVLATIALLVVGIVPTLAGRLAESGSFADRQDIWAQTLPYWLDTTQNDESTIATALNRLAGKGPGTIEYLTFGARGVANAAHNDYILVLTEYGFLGLMAFMAMFAALITSAYRTWRSTSDKVVAAIPLSFVALAVAYLIMSVTDNLFAGTQNQIYFWTLAGLTAAIGQKSLSGLRPIRSAEDGVLDKP